MSLKSHFRFSCLCVATSCAAAPLNERDKISEVIRFNDVIISSGENVYSELGLLVGL